jgi:hypothetical protein
MIFEPSPRVVRHVVGYRSPSFSDGDFEEYFDPVDEVTFHRALHFFLAVGEADDEKSVGSIG